MRENLEELESTNGSEGVRERGKLEGDKGEED